ncbi:MAG: folate family ECF transporter S component [Oscillospiraceae bacterium]|nr:folate family ECF transporter S component [Oscillospiraceae bacterium]
MFKKPFSVRLLCHIAILATLEIVLNRFCSINTMGTKIGFSFVPICICAMLYGPLWAGLTYGLADLVGAIAFPIGPYHVGFTIFAVVRGMIYGFLLYGGGREKLRFSHVLTASIVNPVLVSLCIDTLWVAMLFSSKSYWGWFLYRVPQSLVLVPLQIIVIPILGRLAAILRKQGLAA